MEMEPSTSATTTSPQPQPQTTISPDIPSESVQVGDVDAPERTISTQSQSMATKGVPNINFYTDCSTIDVRDLIEDNFNPRTGFPKLELVTSSGSEMSDTKLTKSKTTNSTMVIRDRDVVESKPGPRGADHHHHHHHAHVNAHDQGRVTAEDLPVGLQDRANREHESQTPLQRTQINSSQTLHKLQLGLGGQSHHSAGCLTPNLVSWKQVEQSHFPVADSGSRTQKRHFYQSQEPQSQGQLPEVTQLDGKSLGIAPTRYSQLGSDFQHLQRERLPSQRLANIPLANIAHHARRLTNSPAQSCSRILCQVQPPPCKVQVVELASSGSAPMMPMVGPGGDGSQSRDSSRYPGPGNHCLVESPPGHFTVSIFS